MKTRVSSLEERLSLDHFVALARDPEAEKIHITLNEMYTCHRLLRKHKQSVCLEGDNELETVSFVCKFWLLFKSNFFIDFLFVCFYFVKKVVE